MRCRFIRKLDNNNNNNNNNNNEILLGAIIHSPHAPFVDRYDNFYTSLVRSKKSQKQLPVIDVTHRYVIVWTYCIYFKNQAYANFLP